MIIIYAQPSRLLLSWGDRLWKW